MFCGKMYACYVKYYIIGIFYAGGGPGVLVIAALALAVGFKETDSFSSRKKSVLW